MVPSISCFRPIRKLLAKRDLRLIQILQRLEVLAVRFEDEVLLAESVDWENPFRTDFSILELLNTEDTQMRARNITKRDCTYFRQLNANDFLLPNMPRRAYLGTRWNRLAHDAKACVIANRNLIRPISKIITVGWHLSIFLSTTKLCF